MSSLLTMVPPRVVLAGTGEVVSLRDVGVGTVDGVVVDGQSEVDESSLTGESFPVPKLPSSEVWAGTMNLDGYIAARTTVLAENSTVARMQRLVEAAQNSRSKTQRLVDSCAKYYTPVVVVLAASVAFVPLLLRAQDLKPWFQLALVLLVSACPCALVLSTPVATFCALLRATRMGVLIKGGDVLESLGEIRVAAFDKTGTITKGEFSIDGVSSIESKSSHPMATALVEYSQSKSIQPRPENVTEFRIYPGEGISRAINGRQIFIGNRRIMARSSCYTAPEMDDHRGASIGGQQSGGHAGAAAARRRPELLPADKVGLVGSLKARAGPTLMVGDGMNDAPALAAADVGVSMGLSGSAAAMETSHATLMSSDMLRVPTAVALGRRTRATIAANVVVSVGAKAAVLALAVAWRPVLWAAVLADVGTCLLVVLYSMLLLREPGTGSWGRGPSSPEHRTVAPRPRALSRDQAVGLKQAAVAVRSQASRLSRSTQQW
ncbi:unnamed protein product [Miscanthus lutarioriparius]|uniref:P-type ATPase A domain-containing protein n=1 Tax=Miscanthus lutarioriparius TaxID=422564 RepID=A0A811NFD4_9POAL|nr:unnamed protein product [Miscanthus lutarioriparius]